MTLFPADKADDIMGPIIYEVTETTVHITWQEPVTPNGMIILYEVNYKRLGDTEVKKHICTHSCHAFIALVFNLSCWVTEYTGSSLQHVHTDLFRKHFL